MPNDQHAKRTLHSLLKSTQARNGAYATLYPMVTNAFFLRVKRPRHKAAEVRNVWSYTSHHPHAFYGRKLLRNVNNYIHINTASYTRRLES